MDTKTGTATLIFLDPLGEHLVTLGNTLSTGVAAGASARPKAVLDRGFGTRLRQLSGTVAIIALSALLVTLVAQKVFQRTYTVSLATPAVAGFDGRTLAATATGQLDFLNIMARPGEVAFAIRANSGETLSVTMPCDCRIGPLGVEAGAPVFAGDPILRLSAPDAPLILTGFLPAERAIDLAAADHVELRFADGVQFAATLAPFARGPPGPVG